MSETTIMLALVFGGVEVAMEIVMSHPGIVLAMFFGFVFLLMLLLAEKPPLQSANEARELTPRVIGKSASGGDLPSASVARESEKVGEKPPAQGIAPVELPVSMKGAETLLMPLVSQFAQMQQQMFDQFQQTVLMMAQMFGNLQREQMAIIRQELEQIRELTRQLHTLQSAGMRPSASPRPASRQAAAPHLSASGLNSKPIASAAKVDTPSGKPCDPDVHVWLSQRLSQLQQERQGRWQKVLSILTG